MVRTGRRSAAGRSVSPTAVIAVLLPLMTVGALAFVQPDPEESRTQPAEQVRPDRVDLVCPAPMADPVLAVAAAGDEIEGNASALSAGDAEPSPVRLEPKTVARVDGPDVTFVRGTGELASALIGARFQDPGLASAECVQPRAEYWFTGVGAGASHASVLELSNPDDGPAVADVTVLGRNGQRDAPTLRGVTVPGGETVRLELANEVPGRGDLGLNVDVSRGRLAATVEDEIPAIGATPATRDWLPASGEPATDQLLLGLEGGSGSDALVVSNPGADEARVELRIVTEDAAFVPEGQREIVVGPESVRTVNLGETLRRQVREGALGVQVVASEPVTATLRSVIDGDLVHAPPVTASGSPMTALVPPGESRLVLARAGGAGVATVAAYDEGELLEERRVELTDGSGGTVELPRRTSLVEVTPRRTAVSAALVSTGDGATVVPLRELVRRALVPAVRPGLPG